jgi:hypothetical protein
MGSSKTGTQDSSGNQRSTTTYTPTAEQTELDKLQLEQARAAQAGTIEMNKYALELGNNLLQGKSLPGYLSGLPGGISPDVTQSIVNSSLRDIQPGMQKAGILDSGVNAAISARTSADIRTQAEQFNLQNLMQLLNLGVGGQAQIQAPIQTSAASLGGRLAGLAGSTTSGNYDSNSHSFGAPMGMTMLAGLLKQPSLFGKS